MRRCPRCGLRLSRSGWSLVLGALAVAMALTVAGLTAYQYRNEIAEALRHRLQPEHNLAPRPTPIEVSSDRLQIDYAANEVAADQRYRGQLLRVTGAVKAIRRDILDAPYLALWTTNEFFSVDARFGREWADRLARVKIGDHVVVQCAGAGMVVGSPQLRECSLE